MMKKILFLLVAFFAFSISGTFTHFYNRTDDLSLRYIFWKKGAYPYPSDIIGHALIADRNRDNLVAGKSKEEIKKLFPSAHEEPISEYQKYYERELVGKEHLWLADGATIIFLKDGVGDTVDIMKG